MFYCSGQIKVYTVANKGIENLKPFKKGDERINRQGRPRSFDAMRTLARKIADETVTVPGNDGKSLDMTRAEIILRQWASSKNPISQQNFMVAAFGKVPDEVVINPESKIILEVEYVDGSNGNGNGNGSGGL